MDIFFTPRRVALSLVPLCLAGCAPSAPIESVEANPPDAASANHDQFVGTYNGSSFETAMGMRITEDGRWEWGLSVGALDMRGAGTWEESGDVITLTSDPKPAPAQFRFQGFEPAEGSADPEKLVHVFRPDGKQFTYAEANIECANGARVLQFAAGSTAYLDGYEPDTCDRPIAVTVEQGIYDITSPRYDLAAMGWETGQIMRFEFDPKDLGIVDFTGATGILEDGILKLRGAKWPLELRKLPRRPDE